MRTKKKSLFIRIDEEVKLQLDKDKIKYQKKEKDNKLSLSDVIRIYQTQK